MKISPDNLHHFDMAYIFFLSDHNMDFQDHTQYYYSTEHIQNKEYILEKWDNGSSVYTPHRIHLSSSCFLGCGHTVSDLYMVDNVLNLHNENLKEVYSQSEFYSDYSSHCDRPYYEHLD